MMSPLRAISSRAVSVALIAGAVGCLDLAHTNPFDPATRVDVRVSGPDSTYSIQQIIEFAFTSEPTWAGAVEWKTTNDNLLHPLGGGRYGVVGVAAPPNDTASAVAILGTHVASHRVVVTQRVVGFRFLCNASASCFFTVGARDATIGFDGRDANGYGMVLPFSAQAESSRPSVLRIDRNLPARAGAFSYAVTPLGAGTSYFIVSSGSTRDSVLVTVR